MLMFIYYGLPLETLMSNQATLQNFIDQTLTNPAGKTARWAHSTVLKASCLQQQVNRPAPRSWWIKQKRKTSNWMWISLFGSSWIPPRMNKAIICNIRHSSSFPPRAFFSPNGAVIQLRSSSPISVAAAVIRRGTLMKQSYFPPTVTEPQDQLLCSSTAEVTPPSSALWCFCFGFLVTNDMFFYLFILFFFFKSTLLWFIICSSQTGPLNPATGLWRAFPR